MTSPIPHTQRVYAPPSAPGSRVAASRSRGSNSCGSGFRGWLLSLMHRCSTLCRAGSHEPRQTNCSPLNDRLVPANSPVVTSLATGAFIRGRSLAVEQGAHNASVAGSIPASPTKSGAFAGSPSLRADAIEPKAVLLLDAPQAPGVSCANTAKAGGQL